MRQLFKLNDTHQFKPLLTEIEESPVSPLAQTIFWIVIMVIASFAIWMVLGQIDVVVSATGKVIPDGEVKIIQPLDTGVVSQIFVREGDFVHKGQALMEIDPAATAPEVESTKRNIAYARLESDRLQATVEGANFAPRGNNAMVATQTALYAANVNSQQKQLRAKEEQLKQIEQQMHTAEVDQAENENLLSVAKDKEERLRKVIDIIAKEDYEKVTNDIVSYRDKIQQAQYKQEELTHQQAQTEEEISRIKEDFVASSLKDLSDRQKQLSDLDAKLEETSFKHSKHTVMSPVDGHIDKLFMHTIGGVVTPAQKLISVVPVNTPLVVEANVLNKDIGFIENKMPVQIKVDAFEFQKYGMYKGVVNLVSHDSRDDQKLGPVFDVYITPTTKYLMVEGKEQALAPGMTVVAEVKVGKRRIIEFFVYPLIKYLHEGMSVR